MSVPVDLELYQRVRRAADRKFGKRTGLYKSAWMVHQYVKRGGRYAGKRDPHHGIVRAFAKLRG